MPHIALAQLAAANSLDESLSRSISLIGEAAGQGADLVMFPELQLSPFFPKHPARDVSQYLLGLDGAEVVALRQACCEAGIYAALNIYLRDGNQAYDASLLIGPDGDIIGISRMVHVTQAPDFYEQDYYAPAPDGFGVYETAIGRMGIVICFDRHYPESIRACVLAGADIILVPTANMHGEPLELFQWEIRVPAFQNSVYIAMCNRVGKEAGIHYCGQSLLAGPDGGLELMMDDHEGLALATFDLERVRTTRAGNAFLTLYDRRNFQSRTA